MLIKKVLSLSCISGLASLFSLATNIYMARYFSIEVFANYSIIMSIVSIAIVIGCLGYDSVIIRFSKNTTELNSYLCNLIFNSWWFVAIFLFLLVVIINLSVRVSLFESIIWSIISLLLCLSALRLSIFININKQIFGQSVEKLTKTFLILASIIYSSLVDEDKQLFTIAICIFISCLFCGLISFFKLRKFGLLNFNELSNNTQNLKPNLSLFSIGIIIAVYGNIDIVLISKLFSDDVVANYALSIKLSLAINIVILAVNQALTPIFAKKKSNRSEVKKAADNGLIIAIIFSLIFFIFVVTFKDMITEYFGDEYSITKDLLFLSAFVLLINVLFGQTFTMMKIWGFEKKLLTSMLIAMVLKYLFVYLFYETVGYMVFMFGSFIYMIVWNMLSLYQLKNKVKIDPSILGIDLFKYKRR
ncbi:oligosaccharide flippase family protein [Vibrio alginolyticus]|uniref:lipopolysaccharide biosynthesis protein n=1 Tax=Vibrio alginolyticus TaxID=663 RepID=UPI00200B09E2|nr:oligosaccharide flippase family protein [Vibrio alginolyticus]UPS14601.1 oligosaccharide flippase family protein [Vibrio alginolyticus]